MVNQSIIEKKNIDKLHKFKQDEIEKQQKIQDEKNDVNEIIKIRNIEYLIIYIYFYFLLILYTYWIKLENSVTKLKKKLIEIENNNKNITCEYNIVNNNNIKEKLII